METYSKKYKYKYAYSIDLIGFDILELLYGSRGASLDIQEGGMHGFGRVTFFLLVR